MPALQSTLGHPRTFFSLSTQGVHSLQTSWDMSKIVVVTVCSVLLQSLVEAKVADDCQKFSNAVAQYERVERLERWQCQLVLRVKKMLTAVAEGKENVEDKGKAGEVDEARMQMRAHFDQLRAAGSEAQGCQPLVLLTSV